MTWPWIARAAFDAVRDERDHLRQRVATLEDHVRRLQRRDAGLPEEPRSTETKPRRRKEPMPADVLDYVVGFPEPMQTTVRARIAGARTQRHTWEDIRQVLREAEAGTIDLAEEAIE